MTLDGNKRDLSCLDKGRIGDSLYRIVNIFALGNFVSVCLKQSFDLRAKLSSLFMEIEILIKVS